MASPVSFMTCCGYISPHQGLKVSGHTVTEVKLSQHTLFGRVVLFKGWIVEGPDCLRTSLFIGLIV
jgi:hypothetical protein